MRKQKYLLIALTLAITVFFNACSEKTEKNTSPSASNTPTVSENAVTSAKSAVSEKPIEDIATSYNENAIMYSNMADEASQNEVVSVMHSYGISKEQTDTFMEWVNDFNKRAHSPLTEGFQEMTAAEIDYDTIAFEPKELDDGSLLPEANCRLTSFLLIKNNIQTNKKTDTSDTYLMFDVEGIETAEQFETHKDKIEDYQCLYNWISMDGLITAEEHKTAVQKAWSERGIQIDNSDKVSMINVYIHSPHENVRIVGHTGVLFDFDGKLLFVEKYGSEAPFQATWFHNRTELEEYVLARKDLYADGEEVAPFVMENGQMLKTGEAG